MIEQTNRHKEPFLSGAEITTSVLVIDNYDSFVYNLVHYIEEMGYRVTVRRNDEVDLEEVEKYDRILLSPGPGVPEEAGLLKEIIARYAPHKSILGVCLGQQAIGEVFGGQLYNLPQVYHGVASKIHFSVKDETLFSNLGTEMEVGRYHSWVVDKNLPPSLEATSFDENGEVMSLRHREYDVRGVQFHPESVLTPLGKTIIKNWLTPPGPEKESSKMDLIPETQPEI